ncbi:hypothetical protein [Actinoallomurus soli]|uniref:hypothetical protein n=1 Tax=Actinoallomurus soli TaxID=2952535 RepID=UPI0020929352|nr:hypothetical protein [Actinoallomurus soli]MCO5973854.1 hypothetical protein [Actinoallomurus soli]
MNADTITAASAVVIALAALAVSIVQTRATLLHNRQSVRPLLQLRRLREYGGPEAGLKITNVGLGPAVITRSIVVLDGRAIGPWDLETVRSFTNGLPEKPHINTLTDGAVLAAGYGSYLIHLDSYDRKEHEWFWALLTKRLEIAFYYQSIYGDEDYLAVVRPFST